MFDKVLRELRKLEQGDRFSIEIELDDELYFDRVCPNPLCASEFKVLFDDWRDKVLDESVHCPICGFIAGSGGIGSTRFANFRGEQREAGSVFALQPGPERFS